MDMELANRALPRDVRKALDLLEADPGRERSVKELAAACGVATRTLQKHFRRFVGRTPFDVQWSLRLERARRDLLTGPPDASVTDIALRWGFRHLGRFAILYRLRYDESPSSTLRNRRAVLARGRPPVTNMRPAGERPSVGILPFAFIGNGAHWATIIADEIAAALCRKHWIRVGPSGRAHYRVRGTIQADAAGRLRAVIMLIDASTGRYIWADRWDGEADASFAFQDRVAANVAAAIERSVRDAEIARAARRRAGDLKAWQLTMQALPQAMSIDAAAQARAIELLERAMELAPEDALPAALAAWCHGQRGGHYFTARPAVERQKARDLAARAAGLNAGDPIVEALAGAAFTLAHDLAPAALHFERALALDGACVWAWNRSGWLNVHRGRPDLAIEEFQKAIRLSPFDPAGFVCIFGIADAHFHKGDYDAAIEWSLKGFSQQPEAGWHLRVLVPALVHAGRLAEAEEAFAKLTAHYPGLTIAKVRDAVPFAAGMVDRMADGLRRLGLPE